MRLCWYPATCRIRHTAADLSTRRSRSWAVLISWSITPRIKRPSSLSTRSVTKSGEATFRTNIHVMFWLARAAVPHMRKGSSIINTASINADVPNPTLLPYATTKGAIHNFTGGLAQILRVSHPGLGVGAPNLSGGSSSRLAARPAKQQEARRTDRSTLRKCSSW